MASKKLPLALRAIRLTYRTLGPMFPEYFGRRAYEMWYRTPRYRTPEREHEAQQTATNSTIDVYGIPVCSYEWGDDDRPPVLFIHGWSGRGTQVAPYIAPLLQAGYRVVSFDGPGHGQTPGKQTSIFQYADVLSCVQQHYGHFAAVITHSFGGMALTFAMQHGFSTNKAVCLCPHANFDRIITNFAEALALPDSVLDAMTRRFYTTHGHLLKELVATERNAANIDCPALLIHDRDDPIVAWQDGEKVAKAWQGAEFLLTEGLKHHRIVHDATVVKATVDFITRPTTDRSGDKQVS